MKELKLIERELEELIRLLDNSNLLEVEKRVMLECISRMHRYLNLLRNKEI